MGGRRRDLIARNRSTGMYNTYTSINSLPMTQSGGGYRTRREAAAAIRASGGSGSSDES